MTVDRRVVLLLLEDSDLDAELLTTQLERDKFAADVRRVETEQDYLRELRRKDVDVVLSDFALPAYDGIAALHAACELAPDVPFIFVSGAIGEERAIETLQRGATDYVLKSRLGRLATAIKRALGLAEERQRRHQAEAERDRLLESERLAREAAEAANRMKDEFLAIASHELRTPLNAMLGWATLLGGGDPCPALVAKGLTVIKRNAMAQSRLIEDILDISRVVTGKLQLRTARFPVSSFVQAAVEAVRPAAEAKDISLFIESNAAEEVIGDGGRLQQVMWNLLSNAVKFTPAQGSIRVTTSLQPESVVISVEDSGQGIDVEFLPHVFERFRQADPSAARRAGGLGLGLSIVRYLVEAHGGKVHAESAGAGHGSCFSVQLPRPSGSEQLVTPAPAASVLEDGAPLSSKNPASLRGIRVLLVEDDPDGRELVAFILRESGASVIAAGGAQEALELLRNTPVDIVVSDIGMPDMDGYSFIRRLRSLAPSAGGRTPAIALTAYARELDRREAEAAGFQRHLAKPVTPSALLNAIAEALGAEGQLERAQAT